MKTIGIAKFKEQCLALLDRLSPEGADHHQAWQARRKVTPYPQNPADLIGSMAGKIEIKGDILSTGVAWDAHAQS